LSFTLEDAAQPKKAFFAESCCFV